METLIDRGQQPPCYRRTSKRLAEQDEPEQDQPITKRLARMKIGDRLTKGSYSSTSPKTSRLPPSRSPTHPQTPAFQAQTAHISPAQNTDDRMFVDDTKHRVYIHDLQSEIAAIEAEEPSGVFLPDIQKKISAIPSHVLQNGESEPNRQLVLYHVPTSISVPEEHDHVRKAILAARTRAAEKQEREAQELMFLSPPENGAEVDYAHQNNGNEDDFDAMDLG